MKCQNHAKCPLCGGNSDLVTFNVKGYSSFEVEWECPYCGTQFETFVATYEIDRQRGEIKLSGISQATRLSYSTKKDPGKATLDHVNPSKRDEDD